MKENYIEFENGSKINIIENTEGARGYSSQEIYYSDAFKKYNKIKNRIKLVEELSGFKLKWYQKIMLSIQFKYDDIVDYFTNPYRMLNKYINKK